METEWWNTVRGVDGISVITTAIQCLLLIVILVIATLSLAYVINKDLRSSNYKILLPYSISIILVIVFCSLTSISSITTSIFMQLNDRQNTFLFVGLTLLFYNASLTAMYILFIFRIHLMPKHTLYKLSIPTQISLFILALALICLQIYLLYIVSSADIHLSHNWRIIDSISFISMSVFYLGATSIIILFMTKLKVLLVNPDHVELSDCMAKMALLVFFSICSSAVIWLLLSTEWIFKEESRFITYLYDAFVVVDAAINMLCTYLSFPFGAGLYNKIFGKIHPKFKEWCKP